MLKLFLFIATASISIFGFGQTKPLILKGKLDNCTEKELYISFTITATQTIEDTIHINERGDFYLKTFKCETPQKISIRSKSFRLDDLLMAPGFELNISGDVTNNEMLHNTLVISGIGACVNSYKKKLEELFVEGKDIPVVYEIDTALTNTINYRDSLLNAVFDNCTDPYTAWFKKLERYETTFGNYSRIFERAIWGNYDNNTYISFINKNIPDTILNDPGKAEWLVSSRYRSFLRGYKEYLLQMANRKDSNIIKNDQDYLLKKVSNIFKGEVREYILSTDYSWAIHFSTSLEELEHVQRKYAPFIDSHITVSQKIILQKEYAEKYSFFETTKKGMPAPGFSLPDPKGLKHSLSDYLGKVIYIDLWASWCGPCRAETGSLKELYHKYRSNKNFVIIGVAVGDGQANWLKAIMEDGTLWLQLRDENRKVSESYNANLIPRFAIIDKKGRIVSMDAPRPSEGKALFKIIDKELLK